MSRPYPFTVLFLLLFAAACQPEGIVSETTVPLTDSVFSELNERRQLIVDTVDGREVRRLLEFPPAANVMKLVNNDRVEVTIRAADLVLGRDSVRLAIIRVTEADPGMARGNYTDYPDLLLLTHYGRSSLPLAGDQGNLGPVSRRTVFRVGRNDYLLQAVDPELAEVTIRPLEPGHQIALAAAFDTRFRSVNVVGLDGRPARIDHRPGHPLAICFHDLHDWTESGLLRINDYYRAGPREPEGLDVALVNHSHSPASIRERVAREGIQIPFYKSTPGTCQTLNCRANLPYCVFVDARGRVTSYYAPLQELERRLARPAS